MKIRIIPANTNQTTGQIYREHTHSNTQMHADSCTDSWNVTSDSSMGSKFNVKSAVK